MDKIERLYKCYEVLTDAGENISEHAAEYREIIQAVKGSSKEKRLASQFIGKFFKHFPSLHTKAIDAQLDLCEDEDHQIRRQAVMHLPKLCLEGSENSAKIADTLSQLLILDEPLELQQIHSSLTQVIKICPQKALVGVFQQIGTGDEATRERIFKFLATKLFVLGPTIVTKEVEDFLVGEIKRVLQDVTADEFHLCMSILRLTKLGSTISGNAELVNIAKEQADFNADIDALTIEDEIVERFIQCATEAMPYFSNTIKSTDFIIYVCDKLFPITTWQMIASAVIRNQIQLRLLKVFAEMCPYCDVLEKASERINNTYIILREYLPLPKLTDTDDVTSAQLSFEFSHIECLMFALHTLGKKNPSGMKFLEDPEQLKDFRARLQYLARGTQGYVKKLEEAVKGKTPDELNSEENQLKLKALKTTSNISVLLRDLFHSPPIFKHEVQLSWVTKGNNKMSNKRHAPITFGEKTENGKDEEKKSKTTSEQKIYHPPSGKYSGRVQNYRSGSNNNRSRSRNGNGNFGGGGGGGGGNNRNRRSFRKY